MKCDNCGSKIQVLDDESLWCPVCDWKGPSAEDSIQTAMRVFSIGLDEISIQHKGSLSTAGVKKKTGR